MFLQGLTYKLKQVGRLVYSGFIRFQVAVGFPDPGTLHGVLDRHCRVIQLVSQRYQEDGRGDMAYRLRMRDPARSSELVGELEVLEGVSNITFALHEEQAEV